MLTAIFQGEKESSFFQVNYFFKFSNLWAFSLQALSRGLITGLPHPQRTSIQTELVHELD